MMTLEQVIADYFKERTNGILTFSVIPKLLAERIRREFCLGIHEWNWFYDENHGWWSCVHCGAEKQEQK